MKKLPLVTTIFSLLMMPLAGYAQELYSSDALYKCTPIQQEKAPIVRKATGKMVTEFTLEAPSRDQHGISHPVDLNEDGGKETLRYTTRSIQHTSMETTVTVQDSAEYETVIHSYITPVEMIGTAVIISPVKVKGKTYLRIIDGKNAHVALDILYQDRGKMTVCKLSDAENIRKNMVKFSMRNVPK